MAFEGFVVISNWTFSGGHPILLVTTVVAVGVWATVMLLFSDCCWIQPLVSVIVACTVKTPLELSIYFLLLTVGITITSFPGKAIFLTVFTMFVIYMHPSHYSRNGLEHILLIY